MQNSKLTKLKKGNRYISLPSSIDFTIMGNNISMKLTAKGVCSNMQENCAAFESWALAIKRWSNYEKIFLNWDKPNFSDTSLTKQGHYQRFLFRAKYFKKDFGTWFDIDEDCQVNLEDLKIRDGFVYTLNLPVTQRGQTIPRQKEAILENLFTYGNLRHPLIECSNAEFIQNQLPVGVLENNKVIFPGKKSAIDIWGISKERELLIFELKSEKNTDIGIISELYFYTNVLRMIQNKQFEHKNCSIKEFLEIPDTTKIKAYFLSNGLHTLIDSEIFALLNNINSKEISYHYIHFCDNHKLTLHPYGKTAMM